MTILENIRRFSKENIDPALANHGGSLEIVDYDQSVKTVMVRYNGMCSHCPSSYMATHATILALLQSEFQEEVADIERV